MGDISVRLSPAGMRVIQDIEKALTQNAGPFGQKASVNTGVVIGGYWLESGGGTRLSYRKARAGESTTVTRAAAMTIKGIIAIAAADTARLTPGEVQLFGTVAEAIGV